MVRSGEVDAMIAFDSYLLPFMARAPCDTVVVGDVFGVGAQGLAVPMNSTLLPALNKANPAYGTSCILKCKYLPWQNVHAGDMQV